MSSSIITLTDSELEQQFGEFIEQATLEKSAQLYKAEILDLIKKGEIDKIKPIYRKLNDCRLFHQARVYLAFGDSKGAIACFKKSIAKGEKTDDSYFHLAELEENPEHYHQVSQESIFYPKALLKLGAECLDYHDYNAAIGYWNEVPSQSLEYSNAQHDIAEIYFQRSNRRNRDENLRLAHKHIKNVTGYSNLRKEIEAKAKEYEVDLGADGL